MATASDIFAHHDRDHRANREISSQQVTRRRQVDERLVDELAPRLADRLAPLLIELVADRLGVTPEQPHGLGDPFTERPEALVDAGEIARRAGRSRWWVYEHASELGAVRLGSGSKPTSRTVVERRGRDVPPARLAISLGKLRDGVRPTRGRAACPTCKRSAWWERP